jgi:hypothetical protein
MTSQYSTVITQVQEEEEEILLVSALKAKLSRLCSTTISKRQNPT